MFSLTVAPMRGKPDALSDLSFLLASSPKSYDDWLKQPITRMILSALEEASRARTPHPGLQAFDYAQAVGEVAGVQGALVALRDPASFLETLGVSGKTPLAPLPPPSYTAPEPPPATTKKGEKKE